MTERKARTARKAEPLTLQTLKERVDTLENEIVELRRVSARADDLTRVVGAITAAWAALDLEITDEAICHDYETIDHDSDQKCPEREGVLVGWGYGSMKGDYRTWWRRHLFRKPDLSL